MFFTYLLYLYNILYKIRGNIFCFDVESLHPDGASPTAASTLCTWSATPRPSRSFVISSKISLPPDSMSVLANWAPSSSARSGLLTSPSISCSMWRCPSSAVTVPTSRNLPVRMTSPPGEGTSSLCTPTGTLHPPSSTRRHARSARQRHDVCQCMSAPHSRRASSSFARISTASAPWPTAWNSVGATMSDVTRSPKPRRTSPALARIKAV
jgi:hypothetical protein